MCEFIAGYEDSKLLKKRMNKLAEEEKNQNLTNPKSNLYWLESKEQIQFNKIY